MSERKENPTPARPFYELPSHYKPCSKIIKETRMQLKYSSKVGSDIESVLSPTPGGSTDEPSETDELLYGNSVVRHGSLDYTGMKAVHTKRPFTPRDSSNFWGTSARKRPPSAITLSRLSLDEVDEGLSGAGPNNAKLSSTRPLFSSSSLGDSPIGYKSDNPIDITRRNFKLMSLANGDGEQLSKVITPGENGSAVDFTRNGSANNSSNEKDEDSFKQINNLEVAIEYLDCFVDNLNRKGQQPPKSDIIAILKRINVNISNINVMEKLKSRLLKLLFKLVEKNQNDEDILFWSSFILLHCQIVGHNLTTVYKMIFKASKSKDYLDTIKGSDYLQTFLASFGKICPIRQTESMIYGYGILKFICTEEYILFSVIDLNVIGIMTTHLETINQEIEKRKDVASENIQNGVFQLTSILRTIVGIPSTLDSVAKSGLLAEVCNSLSYAMKDGDVLSNIVRILSVASEHERCGEVITLNSKFCGMAVKILQVWHSKEDVIVRLMYTLGNVLGKYPEMRIKLYNESISYQMIIQLICYYMENATPLSEDILVKSIRLLANWSLDAEIGSELCDETKLNEILNTLLNSENNAISNELLVCTVATLNNISYYKDYSTLNDMNKKTAESIFNYLNTEDVEVRTEVTKVLGNLTRNVEVRKTCAEHIGALLQSLEEKDGSSELMCAAIGVLINVIADEDCKKEFIRKQGLHYLIDLMDRTHDLRVALMISQLLWNLILSTTIIDEDGIGHSSSFHKEEINELSQALLKKINEFGNDEDENQQEEHDNMEEDEQVVYSEICQDFLSISSNLYDKLISI